MSAEDDFHYSRMQSLVDGLTVRTHAAVEKGDRLWKTDAAGIYELSLTRTSMHLYSLGNDGEYPYIFELYDRRGTLVDTVQDDGWGNPVKLKALYQVVSQGEQRKAREAALTEALSELDLPPF